MTSDNELTWARWQRSVLRLLRLELRGALPQLHFDEIDWPSWENFYHQGRTPRAAIDRALERDL